MAKYAISHKGAEELRSLSENIITLIETIMSQNQFLTTQVSALNGLGVFEAEIISTLSRIADCINDIQDEYGYIVNELVRLANQIDSLCGFDSSVLLSDECTLTPMQELSQYMNSHNYGKDDFHIYSADPIWNDLHKKVYSDYHQIADQMSYKKKNKWVQMATGLSDLSAVSRITDSLEYYSTDAGYHDIHTDVSGKLQETKDILTLFDSRRVPTFKGIIYRGLSFNSKHDLKKALARNRDIWLEPSITSFSADKSVADMFASQGDWGLVLICKNNKTAIPYQHLSVIPSENEVLSPGSHRNFGWRIDYKSKVIDKLNHRIYLDVYEI